MAPVPKNTISHFTHPNHPLEYLSDDQEYICDGCKTLGSDSRFRCHACDFDLHEYCADCPHNLSSSFIHPHLLTLDLLKLQSGSALSDHVCDICLDPVDGLVYRCQDCDFDVHPLCTQLPKQLRHVIDKNHYLSLQKPSSGTCAVCTKDCSSLWVYGCDVCGLNIHFYCLLEPYESSPTQRTEPPVPPQSGTTSRGISFAPAPWPTGPPPPPSYGFAVPYGVPGYPYGYYPFGFNHGPGYNYVHHPVTSQYAYYSAPPAPSTSGRSLSKSMFSLVGRLTMGALTSSIFGFPLDF